MPKTYITKEQRQRAQLSAWVFGQMKINQIRQRELAEQMGISQQALSAKINHRSFSYMDFVTLVGIFKPEHKELDTLLGIDRHREHKE